MNFKNIDTSNLTPEQIVNAELMAEYTRTHECKASFAIVRLAEDILPHLVGLEHVPVTAFDLALKYAQHANSAGEAYMQSCFETWKAARPTEPAPLPEDVSDVDDIPEVDVTEVTPDAEETITRDAAVADTQARVAAGETTNAVEATAAGYEPTGH